MTIIENEMTTIETHRDLTRQIKALKDEKTKVGKELRSTGIEADEQIKADLEVVANDARKVVQGLSVSLTTAERLKVTLDKRIDAGDETVSPLEVVEADMAIRTTKGKQKPADMTLRKAQRAVEPFLADNHLALLAADTLEDLVDVPVLVRKRSSDVQGITDAIVLSQVEPTKGYGSANPSGRVRFSELGNTGLDLEALEVALQGTGSEVQVHPGLVDYEVALWPKPRLVKPSATAVGHFANVFAQTFDAELKRPGTKATNSYAHYDALWRTLEAELEVTEPGVAKGKVVAFFGVEGEKPPVEQMRNFINRTLTYFSPGVHTAAGLLERINVVEVVDAGPWIEGDFMGHRDYAARFRLEIALDYTFQPVESA